MSTIIFDGKKFQEKEIETLRDEVIKLTKSLGRKPKLVTMLNPAHQPSVMYTKVKAKMADRLGVEFVADDQAAKAADKIRELNADPTVDGIMIQQPLRGEKAADKELCDLIDPNKDVDGLGRNSRYMPATVRGVMEILKTAMVDQNSRICVVGNRGLVGARVEQELKKNNNYEVVGMDKDDFQPELIRKCEVIISAAGQPGLIKADMIKDGAVAIDVGYPQGDFAAEAAEKTRFFTPVPGGVGPVTVIMLFKNLIERSS